MPAKRCVETKNICLLFVDYCTHTEKLGFIRVFQEFNNKL